MDYCADYISEEEGSIIDLDKIFEIDNVEDSAKKGEDKSRKSNIGKTTEEDIGEDGPSKNKEEDTPVKDYKNKKEREAEPGRSGRSSEEGITYREYRERKKREEIGEYLQNRTIGIVAPGFPEEEITRDQANNIIAQLAEQALSQDLAIELPRWGMKRGGIIVTMGRKTVKEDLEKALVKIKVSGIPTLSLIDATKLNKAIAVALYVPNKDIKLSTVLGLLARDHKLNTRRWVEIMSKEFNNRGKEYIIEMGPKEAAQLKKIGSRLVLMGGAIRLSYTFLRK